MLTENQIREFKKKLEARFIELRDEIRLELLESDDQHYIDLAGLVHDIGEASVADLLVDLELASIDRHVREIREVDSALMRIASGTYDTCVYCKRTIDLDRLKANPAAKRCRPCQANYEHCYTGGKGPSL
jgi:RNA polymerase-binding transcription factor DksA